MRRYGSYLYIVEEILFRLRFHQPDSFGYLRGNIVACNINDSFESQVRVTISEETRINFQKLRQHLNLNFLENLQERIKELDTMMTSTVSCCFLGPWHCCC